MIMLVSNGAGTGTPEFYCDMCGKPIETLSAGRAFIVKPLQDPGTVSEVRHVHSGACLAHSETDAHGGWVSLDTHLRTLCQTYGLKEVAPPHEGEADVVL